MTKDELNELNIIKTVEKNNGRYSVNGSPYNKITFIHNYLYEKRGISISTQELTELLDEKCADNKVLEKQVQAKLARQWGAKREIKTPVGNIDLMTDSEIIEVKEAKGYKHSIGQIISYAKFYPTHQKVIYLYGKMPKDFNNCYELCKQSGIILRYESD